jgi:hypothetical protein
VKHINNARRDLNSVNTRSAGNWSTGKGTRLLNGPDWQPHQIDRPNQPGAKNMTIEKVLAALQSAQYKLMQIYWSLTIFKKLVAAVISIVVTLHAIQTDLIHIGKYTGLL